jgi:methanethiol S-methyltransferase
MSPAAHLMLLAAAWILYGLIHSFLAGHACKAWVRKRFPAGFRAYRLTFNLVALMLLSAPLALLFSYPGEPLWRWPGIWGWLTDAAALAAIAGFIATYRIYDTGEFLGISQLRKASAALDDQAPMCVSWAHRFVRHPWYFLGLVVIWTREMNAALLVSAVILTLYVLIGSRLEERKLVSLYGEQYRDYQQRVPGLIPLPWRHLSKREADQLTSNRRSAGRKSETRRTN